MLIGELTALVTALLWALSSIFFTIGGQRVGADVMNLTRLFLGLIFIAVTQFVLTGEIFPLSVENWRHGVLFLSAFVGFVLGDAALFYAFVMIGPRLAMLIMTLVPVFSALLARILFGELISFQEGLAILTVVGAIGYVLNDDRSSANFKSRDRAVYLGGIALAVIGALGQTGNLIITKYALVDGFSELAATEIRVLYATLLIGIWMATTGKTRKVIVSFRDRKATLAIAMGALFGPFIGVWLSYVAINYTRVAVASVIMATVPLLLIPLSSLFLGERISIRSIIGTTVAFAAIAVLVLADQLV